VVKPGHRPGGRQRGGGGGAPGAFRARGSQPTDRELPVGYACSPAPIGRERGSLCVRASLPRGTLTHNDGCRVPNSAVRTARSDAGGGRVYAVVTGIPQFWLGPTGGRLKD